MGIIKNRAKYSAIKREFRAKFNGDNERTTGAFGKNKALNARNTKGRPRMLNHLQRQKG